MFDWYCENKLNSIMKIFKPDDIIPIDERYFEFLPNGQKISEVTCNKGKKIPPTLASGNYYELKTVSVKQLASIDFNYPKI